MDESIDAENHGDEPSERAASHHCQLWKMAEHDLIGIYDLNGAEDYRYRGRADGPRFVNKEVLSRCAHGGAREKPRARYLRWLAERVTIAVARARHDADTGWIQHCAPVAWRDQSPWAFFAFQSSGFNHQLGQLRKEADWIDAEPSMLRDF